VVLSDDVLQVAKAVLLAAPVVQRITIGSHFIEPDVFGGGLGDLILWTPDLGEQQNGSADPSIGFKHATRKGDNRLEIATLHQHLAQRSECATGAEQHSLRDDNAGGASLLEQAVDVLDKQQLCL